MKKDFTKEDIIKKHETNMKSAFTAYFLAGVLGVIYIVRYLIKGEFDFHFSLSFTDIMLKLQAGGEITTAICITAIAVFMLIYLLPVALLFKNSKYLPLAAGVYVFDFAALIFSVFVLFPKPQTNDWIIEIVLHIFVLIFLGAGIWSHGKMGKIE